MQRVAPGGFAPPLSRGGREEDDAVMEAPDEFGRDELADDLDEADLTEDEFDAMLAAGEPVIVMGFAARGYLHERVEDYYTLQVSDPRIVPASAGPWGGGPLSLSDDRTPIASHA